MPLSLKLFVTTMLSAELIRSYTGTRSEPIADIHSSEGYPKISIVPRHFPEARLELGHESNDETFEYPSVRIALNDDVSAEISQPLPLNKTVNGVVGERDVIMYASKLSPSGGGALKLFVEARGRPKHSHAAPLIVSVRTRDGGYTFTLPQLTGGDMHPHANPAGDDPEAHASHSIYSMSISRFMCPSKGERDVCYVTLGVGSSAGLDAEHIFYDYDLRLMELEADFWYLNASSAPRGIMITPVMPALFQYQWPPDRSVHSVRVAVASGDDAKCAADTRACVGDDCNEEGDTDACASLAVHSPLCPLTLTPAEILATARHLAFTRCGTMVVRRKDLPDGFFVSVLLNSDDDLCCPPPNCGKNDTFPRRKSVRVSVMNYEANFKAAAASILAGALFIVIGLVSVCLRSALARAAVSTSWEPVVTAISSRFLGLPNAFQIGLDLDGDEEPESDTAGHRNYEAAGTGTVQYGMETDMEAAVKHRNSWQSGADTAKYNISSRTGSGAGNYSDSQGGPNNHSSDDARSGTDSIRNGAAMNQVMDTTITHDDSMRAEPSFVHFSDSLPSEAGAALNRNEGSVRQEPPDHKSSLAVALRSSVIVLNPVSLQWTCALLIAAFGVSNVAIDVAAERRTGSFDRCYRNDLCTHDAGVMPDLNHLLSNVPYIGAGIGFLLAVYAQWHVYEVINRRGRSRACGVPHDFNLFAALGAALAIEGITSGLYHVCPNNRNSHIDFFFIYYMFAALGAKLFQTRRGMTARFHYTPAMLVATITLLGSLQQVPGVSPDTWQRAVVLAHFSSSFLWAVQMYLAGHFGLFVPWCWEITSDLRTRRLAAAHIILNGGLALWGLLLSNSGREVFHSSSYALLYFSLNSGLYVCYYVIMKLVVCRERPPWLSVLSLLIGLATGVPALYFFVIRQSYNTNESPAMSRTINQQCVFLDFYDGHDIWHFLSAAALFFLMLGVLTLDDDLLATPRDRIPVF